MSELIVADGEGYFFHPQSETVSRIVRRIKRLNAKPGYSFERVHDRRLRHFSMFHHRNPEKWCRETIATNVVSEKDALYVHLLLDREFKLIHERVTKLMEG